MFVTSRLLSTLVCDNFCSPEDCIFQVPASLKEAEITLGMTVEAKYSADGRWYSAEVTEVMTGALSGVYRVSYAKYKDVIEILPIEKIRRLRPKLGEETGNYFCSHIFSVLFYVLFLLQSLETLRKN